MAPSRLVPAFFLAAALLIPVPGIGQAPNALDSLFAGWVGPHTPGCVVGVSRSGESAVLRSWGSANLEFGIPLEPGSILEAGSVSKQFAAAALLLLVEEGRISLDTDISPWFPELPDYGATIRVHHLLNHTSGLRDWGSVAAISGWGRGDRTHTHAHALEIIARQRSLNYPPGEAYSYTNTGYTLLVLLVERITGGSFADFSRERIFEPLGLHDTDWRDDYRRIVPGRATAYSPSSDGFRINQPIEDVHGNGGLLTTVADLLTWDEAIRTRSFGGPDFHALLHRQGVLNDGTTIEYASGVQVGSFRGVPSVTHTGATAGYRAYLGRFEEEELSVALLCNRSDANPGNLGGRVAALWLGDALQPVPVSSGVGGGGNPSTPPSLSPGELEGYTGSYHNDEAPATFTVRLGEDGRLRLLRAPETEIPLLPQDTDTFRAPGFTLHFFRGPGGSVSGFSLREGRVHDLRFAREG